MRITNLSKLVNETLNKNSKESILNIENKIFAKIIQQHQAILE